MSATWKTVRVFISSTFRDMQAERDHLVRFVFPKLRQELLQRRIHLVDVDLRWGVTSEQNALSVCREVVDECRPRFLCVLGGRYGWVPPGKTRSITADEVHYGVLDRDLKSRGFTYFYFRDPSATAAMVEVTPGEFREPAGNHGAVALAELKTAIIEAGLQPFIYRAQWDDQSRRLIGLKEFGDRVYADLKQSIDQEFGPTTGEKPDEFTEENAAMEAFIEERVQRFVLGSRQPVWNELRQHAESTGGNGYLCLTGAAGSGKSALLAHFSQHSTLNNQPSTLLITHFVGASPGSTDVRRTLRRLCHELVTGAALTAKIPEDPEKLRVAFAEILQQAAAKKRVVILLDAINQFDPATQLAGSSWLPEELPANARVILSLQSNAVSEVRSPAFTRSGATEPPEGGTPNPALDELRRRRNPPKEIELQPLDAPDREAIIREFLHRYRKSMTDDQRAALLAKADAGTPLYLLVALEELRTLGTYEEITDRIAQLPPDTRALFIWILKRLEGDDGFRDASGRKIGRELVTRFVSLLGASRHGLSQQELVELLSPSDPQGNVAALAQLLRPYLMQRGELLDFYHGQLREAVTTSYLPSESQRLAAHDQLATYFRDKADPDGNGSWTGQHTRGWSELAFHMFHEGRTAELTELLMTYLWIRGRLRVTGLIALLDDYGLLQPERNKPLGMVQGALQLAAHLLFRDTRLLPTEITARLLDLQEPELVQLVCEVRQDETEPWLRPLTSLLTAPGGHLLRTLEGHGDGVLTVAVTPDGQWAVSGSWGQTLKVWDLGSGSCLRTLEGHGNYVWAVAVTPDGRRVIAVSEDKMLKVWNLKSGDCLQILEGHPKVVRAVAVTPDGQRAISGSEDKTLKIWDLESGVCLRTLEGHGGSVLGVAATPDGRRAVSGSADETLKVWDLDSGVCLRTLEGHGGSVLAVAVTPDGRRAVSGSYDNTLKVWDLESGVCLRTLPGHSRYIRAVAVTPDGHRAISGSADATLKIWDLESGVCLRTLEGHVDSVAAVVVTPDGRRAVSGSQDKTLKVWDLEGGDNLRKLEGHDYEVERVAVTPDGQRAVSGSRAGDNKILKVWNPESGDCLRTLEDRDSWVMRWVLTVAVMPSGRWLISGSRDKSLKVWDLESGTCLRTLAGHNDSALTVAVTPDGRRVVSGSMDKSLKVWDVESAACLRTMTGHGHGVLAVAVTPDGRRGVSGSYDNTLKVWDLESGVCLRTLSGHSTYVCDVAVTLDGRRAVSGSGDATLKIWDLESGNCLRTLDGHRDGVLVVAVTPDGRRAISGHGSMDKALKVWDLESGNCVLTLEGHAGEVSAIAVTPDGRRIVSGAHDKTLKVWDLESGQVVATFIAESLINACAVGPDSVTIAVGDGLGQVHFLRLENLPDLNTHG